MAFHLGEDDGQGMNEINLIPLIDVMLVLMIIFLVTATVINPAVPLALPKTSASVPDQPPKTIQISIDVNGDIFWDKETLSLSDLTLRLQQIAAQEGDKSTINLRADKDSRYDTVAKVLAEVSGAGLTKVAFVSE